MTEHQALDHSLTSMEWLYRLSDANKLDPSGINGLSQLNPAEAFPKLPDNLFLNRQVQINNQTLLLNGLSPNENGLNQVNRKSSLTLTTAQRAEPHRPIDLTAEYRGNEHGKREGKPPYSYVNLITFAINSTPKRRMTLNEIYQWISDNFNYYKNAGTGWKVIRSCF
jgi:hypothetical protein